MTEFTIRYLVVLAACLLPTLAHADAPPAEGAAAASAPAAPALAAPPSFTPAAALSVTPPATPVTAAAEARPAPRWSFGGGLSYVVVALSSQGTEYILRDVPAATASLERRVSPRSWAVLGLSGTLSRVRDDLPEGYSGISRDDYRHVAVSAGLRRVHTRSSAPVEVSTVYLAQGGVFDGETVIESGPSRTSSQTDFTAWFAGAEVGISLERQLTEGLSFRVASPLLGVRYGVASFRTPGQPDVESTSLSAGLTLSPRLELRLLF